MVKIGVTGGIGSGKSVVSTLLRAHGIPVFDADREAKIINDTSPIVRKKLIELFGSDIYCGKQLNRQKLASYIFTDDALHKKVNGIIHPEVAKTFMRWVEERKAQPIVAIEAALLIEAKFHHLVDKTITVHAPYKTRIDRVMQRDGVPRSAVLARMQKQLSEEEKIAFAHFIIYNDNCHSLIEQVNQMLTTIREKLSKST